MSSCPPPSLPTHQKVVTTSCGTDVGLSLPAPLDIASNSLTAPSVKRKTSCLWLCRTCSPSSPVCSATGSQAYCSATGSTVSLRAPCLTSASATRSLFACERARRKYFAVGFLHRHFYLEVSSFPQASSSVKVQSLCTTTTEDTRARFGWCRDKRFGEYRGGNAQT